jgi:hypothetical protein
MSPEQARGESSTGGRRASFGVVLYEMATGREPFGRRTSALVFDAILNQPRASHRRSTRRSAELEHIILKALEKDRDLRYQTAAELRADLKRLRRETAPKITTARRPCRGARWRRGVGPWRPDCCRRRGPRVDALARAPARTIDSVAVLPFIGVGATGDAEYCRTASPKA